LGCASALAQEPTAKPGNAPPLTEKPAAAKNEEKPALPFQIQLLETHIRFESDGDSRKEVHTIVKINDLAGARQFSRLGFDYNRAFQQVEIPLVKISHANGGTSEILPSAITDAPNPAVQDFPAYHDVRVKSVRLLGLQDGDTIEYRVITTTTKHPLAPDFWLEHTFDRSGQVMEEEYEIELPHSLVQKVGDAQKSNGTPAPEIKGPLDPNFTTNHLFMTYSEEIPEPAIELVERLARKYTVFSWKIQNDHLKKNSDNAEDGRILGPDVEVSTYTEWKELSASLFENWRLGAKESPQEAEKVAAESTARITDSRGKLEKLFEFVATKLVTVDVPLGGTLFGIRSPEETLKSGYGSTLDKTILLVSLARAAHLEISPALVPQELTKKIVATHTYVSPTIFRGVLVCDCSATPSIFVDPGLEVAPFGMVPAELRGKPVLLPLPLLALPKMTVGESGFLFEREWRRIPTSLPFEARQKVNIEASLDQQGALKAKVKYVIRGDNELLLRLAFHQTPKERWKDVAGLLALSDGFRGTITSVTASDPMATKEPFTVEYEITQAKFVDWSKKPVRIPALLPQIALPDSPGKTAGKIELGTPLDVQTSLTLKLPAGTTVQTPAATSVARDYATFASKYDAHLSTITASRQINFVMREIPVERAADYNAFLRAVQNDQAQMLVLLPPQTQQEN
jgi:transglutaminase-like putative cysteine protease